jgi:hypothetical protein
MFKRRSTRPDATDASAYSRRAAVADSVWSAQDRLRSGFGTAFRAVAEVVGRPFERVGYGARKRVLWPLEDRAETMGAPARALSTAAVVLLAAGAGVAGLLWAAPDRPDAVTATQVAVSTAPPPTSKTAPEKVAEPTLQGAAPVFKPAEARASEVDPAKAIVKSSPATEQSNASSSAKAAGDSAAVSTSAVDDPAVDGPPAGPAALAVARDFAGAFVLYETGDSDSGIRETFGETATPALAKALLRRPPRLPANVEVPKAKVVNVVPAPSHGDVYPVSVSLLRVGLTSELRLEMEQRKGDRWRVTNVLG